METCKTIHLKHIIMKKRARSVENNILASKENKGEIHVDDDDDDNDDENNNLTEVGDKKYKFQRNGTYNVSEFKKDITDESPLKALARNEKTLAKREQIEDLKNRIKLLREKTLSEIIHIQKPIVDRDWFVEEAQIQHYSCIIYNNQENLQLSSSSSTSSSSSSSSALVTITSTSTSEKNDRIDLLRLGPIKMKSDMWLKSLPVVLLRSISSWLFTDEAAIASSTCSGWQCLQAFPTHFRVCWTNADQGNVNNVLMMDLLKERFLNNQVISLLSVDSRIKNLRKKDLNRLLLKYTKDGQLDYCGIEERKSENVITSNTNTTTIQCHVHCNRRSSEFCSCSLLFDILSARENINVKDVDVDSTDLKNHSDVDLHVHSLTRQANDSLWFLLTRPVVKTLAIRFDTWRTLCIHYQRKLHNRQRFEATYKCKPSTFKPLQTLVFTETFLAEFTDFPSGGEIGEFHRLSTLIFQCETTRPDRYREKYILKIEPIVRSILEKHSRTLKKVILLDKSHERCTTNNGDNIVDASTDPYDDTSYQSYLINLKRQHPERTGHLSDKEYFEMIGIQQKLANTLNKLFADVVSRSSHGDGGTNDVLLSTLSTLPNNQITFGNLCYHCEVSKHKQVQVLDYRKIRISTCTWCHQKHVKSIVQRHPTNCILGSELFSDKCPIKASPTSCHQSCFLLYLEWMRTLSINFSVDFTHPNFSLRMLIRPQVTNSSIRIVINIIRPLDIHTDLFLLKKCDLNGDHDHDDAKSSTKNEDINFILLLERTRLTSLMIIETFRPFLQCITEFLSNDQQSTSLIDCRTTNHMIVDQRVFDIREDEQEVSKMSITNETVEQKQISSLMKPTNGIKIDEKVKNDRSVSGKFGKVKDLSLSSSPATTTTTTTLKKDIEFQIDLEIPIKIFDIRRKDVQEMLQTMTLDSHSIQRIYDNVDIYGLNMLKSILQVMMRITLHEQELQKHKTRQVLSRIVS
jgi:hypothetical protein